MTTGDTGYLFRGDGTPIGAVPSLDGVQAIIRAKPFCRILNDFEVESDGTVSLIWIVPTGGPHAIDPAILAELVAVADTGGAIAIHADTETAIFAAIDRVLALAGGGHA